MVCRGVPWKVRGMPWKVLPQVVPRQCHGMSRQRTVTGPRINTTLGRARRGETDEA